MYQLPPEGYTRQNQLIPGIVPISKSTLWAWVKDGKFPKPVKLGPRTTAWKVSEIRDWIDSHASSETVQ